jgi:hypothetical protein
MEFGIFKLMRTRESEQVWDSFADVLGVDARECVSFA